MSARTLTMTDPLYDYLLSVNRPLPDLFARLRAETSQLPMAGMQISVEQGRFMELVTQLIQAKKVLGVGVFFLLRAHPAAPAPLWLDRHRQYALGRAGRGRDSAG